MLIFRSMRSNPLLLLPVTAFALFSVAAGARVLHPVDARVLRASQSLTSGVLDAAGTVFSVMGGVEFVGVAAAALAGWLVLSGRGPLAGRLLVAFVATGLIELVLKTVLPQVPVPERVGRTPDPSILDVDTPYPYPSGHMLRSVILLGAVFVLWPNRLSRVAVLAVLFGVAASRVYLGVHWASDVIGGALLGVAGLAWAFREQSAISTQPSAKR